ncbi:GNAT family N-acetyltransferase [Pseudaminobacter soli (ex Li et al. 2025)]|uniref:GNAT family N-acetyltransferase n=1 Tax=Pseudaminobacter soli (ex Li et al. 2025) TaxID=1295366 RepID=A0A2P7SFM6_9HYPH|nr:GNAT family N-acetyltransferase [Mesorhizobium soli]PSJ61278.1 GNAT family N-acetyltransferase [Mesorhizobium soli]
MLAEIRPARKDDVDALMALELAVFVTDRISRQSFRRMVSSLTASLLVADQPGGILGYCAVLYRTGSKSARLYSLAVAPNSGGGQGRALLAAAEQAARDRGCTSMRLEVRRDNPRAIALYEKNGYRPIGSKPGYYADGMDALRYAKPLDPPSQILVTTARKAAGTSTR